MIPKQATLIKNAFTLIESETELDSWRLLQSKQLIAEIKKEANLWEWLKNPMISTILSLLNPLIGKSFKIAQAVKLLLEGLSEAGVK